MYFRNKDFDRAFRFVESLDFDVLCLQEVPEHFLERLKALPYEIRWSVDVDRLFKSGAVRNYLVILSKYPMRETKTFSFELPHLPLRTKAFRYCMQTFGWSIIEGRTALIADIALPSFTRPVRVACLHLLLAHPSVRFAEFERAMMHMGEASEKILCGDFNVIESPKVSLISWAHGGTVSDTLRWKRERAVLQARFAHYRLVNPHLNMRTHPFSRSQLDHILVSGHMKIKDSGVMRDATGSDHLPIFVELDMTAQKSAATAMRSEARPPAIGESAPAPGKRIGSFFIRRKSTASSRRTTAR